MEAGKRSSWFRNQVVFQTTGTRTQNIFDSKGQYETVAFGSRGKSRSKKLKALCIVKAYPKSSEEFLGRERPFKSLALHGEGTQPVSSENRGPPNQTWEPFIFP
jgi:hypothetical protein